MKERPNKLINKYSFISLTFLFCMQNNQTKNKKTNVMKMTAINIAFCLHIANNNKNKEKMKKKKKICTNPEALGSSSYATN